MLMIFKLKKKVGDLFILGFVVQKSSPQMIYCLNFFMFFFFLFFFKGDGGGQKAAAGLMC